MNREIAGYIAFTVIVSFIVFAGLHLYKDASTVVEAQAIKYEIQPDKVKVGETYGDALIRLGTPASVSEYDSGDGKIYTNTYYSDEWNAVLTFNKFGVVTSAHYWKR